MKNLEFLQNLKESNMSAKEYVQSESQNDPNFFRWLFDKDFEKDFDSSLTEEEKKEFNEFLESL